MPFGELNYEKLVELQPDLMIATHSGITDKAYAHLAQIASTLAQLGDAPDFGIPWQDQTTLIGRAHFDSGLHEKDVIDYRRQYRREEASDGRDDPSLHALPEYR